MSLARNALTVFSGNFLAQIVALISLPIIANIFGPGLLGIYAVCFAVCGIFSVIGGLRYEQAIMLPERDEEAISVAILAALSAAGVSLILFFGAITGMFWGVSAPPSYQPVFRVLWMLPLIVLLSVCTLVLSYWHTRLKRYRVISLGRILFTLSLAIGQIVLGSAGYVTITGMLLPVVLAQGIYFGLLFVCAPELMNHLRRRRMNWKPELWQTALRYKRFPTYEIAGTLLNALSWQLPLFFLSSFFSSHVAGQYALGNRLVRGPMSVLGQSVSQVFFQSATEARRTGSLDSHVERIVNVLVWLTFLPLMTLSLIAPDAIVLFMGEEWRQAGHFLQILSVWTVIWFISSPLSCLFAVLERQNESFKLQTFIFVTRVISLTIGGVLGDPYLAVGFFAVSGVITYGWLSVAVLRLAGLPYKVMRHALLVPILKSAPLLGIIVLMDISQLNPYVFVFVSIGSMVLFQFIFIAGNQNVRTIALGLLRRRREVPGCHFQAGKDYRINN